MTASPKECIFCRIASGEVSAGLVHSDDTVVAFRDRNPQAPSHLLIIPRRHVGSLRQAGPEEEELLGHIVRVAAQLAEAEGVAERGFRLVANCGPEAGQSVDHIHFHLLGGRRMGWPPG
jgi:histidine triad (HIT) family protein